MSIPAFCRTCPTKRPRTRKDPGSIIYPPENDSLETVPALDRVAAAAELFLQCESARGELRRRRIIEQGTVGQRIDAICLDPASRDRAEHGQGLVLPAEVLDRIGPSGIGAAHGDIAQGLRPGYGLLEIGEHAVEAIGCRLVGDLVEADFEQSSLTPPTSKPCPSSRLQYQRQGTTAAASASKVRDRNATPFSSSQGVRGVTSRAASSAAKNGDMNVSSA